MPGAALLSTLAYTALAFSAAGGDYGGQWGGSTPGLTPLTLSPCQRLNGVMTVMRKIPMGGTDCALPMLWAARQGVAVDTFVVYTDNETWAGQIHPSGPTCWRWWASIRQRRG